VHQNDTLILYIDRVISP